MLCFVRMIPLMLLAAQPIWTDLVALRVLSVYYLLVTHSNV